MTTTIAEFTKRAVAFARKHPDAVLDMKAPELAVDPRAYARHLRSTCSAVRQQMFTTARLALVTPDLFHHAARRQTAERQTA